MKITDFIGAQARIGAEQSQKAGWRKLLVGAAALARKNPAELASMVSGLAQAEAFEAQQLDRWSDLEEIDDVTPQRFDVCDLRIWLKLAEEADVDAIPAKEVARLSHDELEVLLGRVKLPKQLRETIAKGLKAGLETESAASGADDERGKTVFKNFDAAKEEAQELQISAYEIFTKMETALDEVPSDWMVRTHLAGSNNLKALVGCGLMTRGDVTAKVQENFEIGGGWVRAGNRRLIDFSDPRFIETAIGGHKPFVSYLARPWAPAGRYHEAEDLHRANTPIAGRGVWPAEWRVFVRAGEVTGVANYYGWTGDGATAENAWNAVEAAAAAQDLVDLAERKLLSGAFMNQDFIRNGGRDKQTIETLDRDWPEDRMHCTLDFLESDKGLVFLEAGPAHMPGGGGHPCAFAGQGVEEGGRSIIADCDGVAYLAMPHVHLGEPSTWHHGETEGCIDTWSNAVVLARDHAAFTPRAERFVERLGLSAEPGCDMEP